ncbi:hypothetical protein WA026_019238 [Henosepilachna vigintioctopunctata]|uniref:Uncharacterized protein n=1 Tax=Henosepilachna vigintioctopunctata TaxID=420089 RepID=A0AAW1V4D5_9CUCU
MATTYYSGDYTNQYNTGTPYYSGNYANNQSYNMNPGFMNDFQAQRFMNQNNFSSPQPYMNQMYQNYLNSSGYPNTGSPNYGSIPQGLGQQYPLNQTQQMPKQPIQKSTPSNQNRNQELPLEIRGGVIISNCLCSKKNGLQDHCKLYNCRLENENKRLRRKFWQDPPTKDTNVDLNRNTEAENLIINPSYNESYGDKMVPSNAEPVPVAYNYNM